MKKKVLSYSSKLEEEVVKSFAKDLREKLGDEIVAIELFGSRVRGDFQKDPDMDVFILVKKKTARVSDAIGDLTTDYIFEYNLALCPVLYDLFEYRKNKELGSFFFESVQKEGAVL